MSAWDLIASKQGLCIPRQKNSSDAIVFIDGIGDDWVGHLLAS